jgi:hypothetical protein
MNKLSSNEIDLEECVKEYKEDLNIINNLNYRVKQNSNFNDEERSHDFIIKNLSKIRKKLK